MTNVPLDGNDNLFGVQEPTLQAGERVGGPKAPLTRYAEGVFVEQPGLDNYPVGIPTLKQDREHTAHDDATD